MAFRFPRMPQMSRKWRERTSRWKESFLWYFGTPWRWITGAFSWVGGVLAHAWGSRNLRNLLQGCPALLAIAGVMTLGIAAYSQDRNNLGQDYRMAASAAWRNGDFAEARSFSEKAIQLEGPKPEYQYLLAISLEGEKKNDHTLAIMRKIAPNDKAGYPRAHIWTGDFISRFTINEQAIKMMRTHYLWAYQAAAAEDPKSPVTREAAGRLGMLYLTLNRLDDAEPYLKQVALENPEVRLRLAGICFATGRKDEGNRYLESAASFYQSRADADLANHDARFRWADALSGQEKYAEALRVLEKGKAVSQDVRYAMKMSDVFAAWESTLAAKPETPFIERFQLLQSGLAVFPSNRQLLARLIELSSKKSPDADKANQFIQEMIANGQGSPSLHYLLGSRAFAEGNAKEAVAQWEKAYALDPGYALVANNLAYMISQEKDADLGKALAMINGVIAKAKNVPQFYGTRGEILFKQGNFKDAVPDLEKGLVATPNNLHAIEELIECHKQLGNTVQEKTFQAKAEELRAKLTKPAFQDPAAPAGKDVESPKPPADLKPEAPAPKPGAPAPK